jgi:C_GCAxxG_C_C family probable redox protein
VTNYLENERAKQARDLFLTDANNCTQAIFRAYADLDEQAEAAVMPLAWALGGGLAGQGHVCGTLLGAVMVLGAKLYHEYNLPADEAQAAVADFIQEFEIKNESLLCSEIVGDLNEEGFERVCRPMIYDVSQMLDEFLTRFAKGHTENE